MPVTILAPLAALLYLAATALQLLHIFQRQQQLSRWFVGLSVAALLCHGGVVCIASCRAVAWNWGFTRCPPLSS